MATGIGETLRAARREQGRSLADAAAETRVRETYLAALEQEDFTAIGGDVYAKGFLRSYAKALGLDPEPLLDAYRQEFGAGDTGVPVTSQPVEPVRSSSRQPGTVVIVAAGGVVLVVLAIIGLLGDSDAPEEEAGAPGPSPVETPEESEPDTETDDEDDTDSFEEEDGDQGGDEETEDEEAEDVEGLEVAVSVVDAASWLRVQVDGTTMVEGTRSEGFSEQFDGEEEIVVRVGDASVVTVEANGQDQGQLGSSGEVVVVTCAEGETDCDIEVVPT